VNNADVKPDPKTLKITLCMGSSCFSRGNSKLIEIIRMYAKTANVDAEIAGHLCENQCALGPNIIVDGTPYNGVQASSVPDILHKHLTKDEVPK
jgi:biotin synthase